MVGRIPTQYGKLEIIIYDFQVWISLEKKRVWKNISVSRMLPLFLFFLSRIEGHSVYLHYKYQFVLR